MSDGLTAEQLGELEPGDPVTIETAVTGRRPSLATGTVVRTEPTAVIVAVPRPRWSRDVHRTLQPAGRRPGGPLDPADVEVPSLREVGLRPVSPGQWRDVQRVVDDERGA